MASHSFRAAVTDMLQDCSDMSGRVIRSSPRWSEPPQSFRYAALHFLLLYREDEVGGTRPALVRYSSDDIEIDGCGLYALVTKPDLDAPDINPILKQMSCI